MAENQIRIAVRIPEKLVETIDLFIAEQNEGCDIEKMIPSRSEASVQEDLGFDPVTASPIVWLAIKFVGAAAVNVALGLITNAIYDYLKQRDESPFEVIIRFPSATEIYIRSNEPLDLEYLEESIRRDGIV